jgi:hypothetical protein
LSWLDESTGDALGRDEVADVGFESAAITGVGYSVAGIARLNIGVAAEGTDHCCPGSTCSTLVWVDTAADDASGRDEVADVGLELATIAEVEFWASANPRLGWDVVVGGLDSFQLTFPTEAVAEPTASTNAGCAP